MTSLVEKGSKKISCNNQVHKLCVEVCEMTGFNNIV